MKKKICFVVVLFYAKMAFAQFQETISSDRPGQATSVFTVGKKVLQVQQGIDYASILDLSTTPQSLTSNNVIRYGLFKNFELNMLVDYNYTQYKTSLDNRPYTYQTNGISDLRIGFRLFMNKQKTWIPATAFQVRMIANNSFLSQSYGTNNLGFVALLVTNWQLPKKCNLSANWILLYDGNVGSIFPKGRYVVNFSFPVYQKWSAFVENYGEVFESIFQTRFDGGVMYLLNDNIQLDLSGGYGNNYSIKDFFISTGISWRIARWREKE